MHQKKLCKNSTAFYTPIIKYTGFYTIVSFGFKGLYTVLGGGIKEPFTQYIFLI